jgi:hypothetical protein
MGRLAPQSTCRFAPLALCLFIQALGPLKGFEILEFLHRTSLLKSPLKGIRYCLFYIFSNAPQAKLTTFFRHINPRGYSETYPLKRIFKTDAKSLSRYLYDEINNNRKEIIA